MQNLVDQMEQEENAYVGVFYESYNTGRQEDQL